jgi:hypothetical protein
MLRIISWQPNSKACKGPLLDEVQADYCIKSDAMLLQAKAAILSVSLVLETPGLKGGEIDSSSSSDEEDEEVQKVQKESKAASPQHKGSVQFGVRGAETQQDSDDEEQEGTERADSTRDAHILSTAFAARSSSKTM